MLHFPGTGAKQSRPQLVTIQGCNLYLLYLKGSRILIAFLFRYRRCASLSLPRHERQSFTSCQKSLPAH